MTTKLLVYGTLKSDGALHSILKTGKILGEYITKSKGYAGYEFKELDDDIWGFLYPKQIGNYSNNIQVNEEEKYIEWLNF